MSTDSVKAQLQAALDCLQVELKQAHRFVDAEALVLAALKDPILASVVPVPVPVPVPVGNTIRVAKGGNLQAAYDAAQPGDTVLVYPDKYPQLILRAKAGTKPVVIAPDTTAFVAGQRIDPSFLPGMISLVSNDGFAPLRTEGIASNHILRGFNPLFSADGRVPYVDIGDAAVLITDVTKLPDNVILDQCYLVGDPIIGGKRGFRLNCRGISILNSYVKDMFFKGEDSQAVGVRNGPGPYTIINNYMEATGENVLFGGADNLNVSMNPTNIVIRGNYLTKPPAWQTTKPGVVKNLLELKNAFNVLIENNVIENTWTDGQTGTPVLFTVRNQDGASPWNGIANVVFQYNVVRNASAGLVITGRDDLHQSARTVGIKVLNNLFYNIDWTKYPGQGRMFALYSGVKDVEIGHNTCIMPSGAAFLAVDAPFNTLQPENNENVNMHDNIMSEGEYGLIGDNTGLGLESWNKFTANSAFERNLIALGTSGRNITYPGVQNYKTAAAGELATGADFKLLPKYAGLASTDGKPLGADIDGLRSRISF